MLHRSTGSEDESPPILLRWAGGKQRLIPRLSEFVPADYMKRTYREPFLGAASLFLSLQPRKAVLSDLNRQLIDCYFAIRDQVTPVARMLRELARADNEGTYYEVRDQYVQSSTSGAQAARFIYLNRTCFNGIFRVNRAGQFNVPYGHRTNPIFPTAAQLRRVSSALNNASLQATDYQEALKGARNGDFVYLDPPYPPLNGTSFFAHYTPERFSRDDQEMLAELVQELDRRGCLVLMTNADTPHIRSLYRDFNAKKLPVTRYVTCKSTKHQVGELVVTNYDISRSLGTGSARRKSGQDRPKGE